MYQEHAAAANPVFPPAREFPQAYRQEATQTVAIYTLLIWPILLTSASIPAYNAIAFAASRLHSSQTRSPTDAPFRFDGPRQDATVVAHQESTARTYRLSLSDVLQPETTSARASTDFPANRDIPSHGRTAADQNTTHTTGVRYSHRQVVIPTGRSGRHRHAGPIRMRKALRLNHPISMSCGY